MFDLKVMRSVLGQLEEERGIPQDKMIEAIETALATAYRKEYGKRSQIIRAIFDIESGSVQFVQIKEVVSPEMILGEDEEPQENDEKIRFNDDRHILIDTARMMKKDVQIGEEMVFPLESKDNYGRISAQTAKQVIMQKIREAEKISIMRDFGTKQGEIISGTIQRVERGNIYLDIGRSSAILPYEEQIAGERFRQGERVRAYLYKVEETPSGVFLKVSRSHPKFLEELFKSEVPELTNGSVEIKSIAREAGSRSKIAVYSHDEHVDPVGALVGQRGVRVSTVMSELGGEKIDIIEWSEDPAIFIEDSLSPAQVVKVEANPENKTANVLVSEDQQSLAIGKGGQNVRLAAKLTGWRIDIKQSNSSGTEISDSDTISDSNSTIS